MTGRIKEICSHLPQGKILADVGCDHGYCAEYALKNDLFEKVYISDISAGSLKKAERLLKRFIGNGRCIPVLADGMKGLSEHCDCVLIAGLGGEEILKIAAEGYLPEKFVFQPMRNAEKLRRYLIEQGAKITADYTFGEGHYYYDLIVGENEGGSSYTDREILYGKDNLTHAVPAFLHKAEDEIRKLGAYLQRDMSSESRREIIGRLNDWEEVYEITRRL